MKAVLRPAFVLGLSIAMAATSLMASSVALAATRPTITDWPTTLVVNEGDKPTIQVTFSDPDGPGFYAYDVFWGDGDSSSDTISEAATGSGPWTFHVTKPTPYAAGEFVLQISVNDGGPANTRFGNVTVLSNTPPSVVSFGLTAGSEGGTSSLALTFADPDALDTHPVSVAWGDGATSDPVVVPAGGTTFDATHVYADTGTYAVVVTLKDSAGHTVTAGASVSPTNVAPVVGTLSLSPSSVVDHQTLTLSGDFTDPGTVDTFTLTVDWGDLTSSTESLAAGTRLFSATHAYDAAGPVTITATVEDRDGGKSSLSLDLVVLPSNHAPADLAFDATATGANVVVTGSFIDPDTTDTHTLTLTWGDNASATQDLAAGVMEFNAPHVYGASGTYTVTATVTDHPAGASTSPLSKQVVVTVPAESASDVIDEMSVLVRSLDLDRNTERWLLKKLDDLQDSLAYGNSQVCSSTGALTHILAFAQRTLADDQYAALSALATNLEVAAGCTSQGNLRPKVLRASTVTTTRTTVTPASTPEKDTTALPKSESKPTEGRRPR